MRRSLWSVLALATLWVAVPSGVPAAQVAGRGGGAPPPVQPGAEQQTVPGIGQGTAAISGTILDATSRTPIAGAVVSLGGGPPAATPGPPRSLRVITDEKGRFVFTHLPAGGYLISASKFGYFNGGFGQRGGSTTLRRITLVDGQWFRDANVELRRPSSISGTVIDEAGEPLVDVFVRACAVVFVAGARQIASGPIVRTDERGVYRFGQLTPGTYIVTVLSVQHAVPASTSLYDLSGTTPEAVAAAEAAGRAAPLRRDPALALDPAHRLILGPYPTPPPTADGRPQAYPLTFYPAARIIDEAQAIELAAGEDRQGVDLQLRPVPTFRISGRLDGPAEAYAGMLLRLMPSGSERLGRGNEAGTALVGADGTFTFLNIPDGSYVLLASRNVAEYRFRPYLSTENADPPRAPGYRMSSMTSSAVSSGPMGTSFTSYAGPGRLAYHGRAEVDVNGGDVTNLVVPLRSGVTISGRIVWDLSKENQGAPRRVITVVADPANGDPSLGQPRSIRSSTEAPDEFTIEGLLAGEYLLRPFGAGTVKSIVWNGKNYTYTPFDASAGGDITGVVMTVTDMPGRVTGQVRDAAGAPAPDAAVLYFPADRAEWRNYGMQPARMRATTASTTGAFTLTLPAGDYLIVALDEELIEAWKDPAFLDVAARVATKLSVDWGDSKTQDLVLQRVR